MNGSKYKGRDLTVEFSVPKGSYESRIQTIVEHTNMERQEAIKPMSVKNQNKEDAKAQAEAEAKVKE